MSSNREMEKGTVRILVDKFRISNRDIEYILVKGLTEEGFDVNVVPEFSAGDIRLVPQGSTIEVYRKENVL